MKIAKLYFLIFTLFHCSSIYAISTHDVFETTFSIFSYTKWDTVPPITICIVDNPKLTQQFKAATTQNKHHYTIEAIESKNINQKNCDALLFSSMTPQQEAKTINNIQKSSVLTLSLNNEACEIGSAICLYKRDQHTAFKVNMTSLSKSKIHIDPRVLLLTKKAGTQ